MSFYHGSIIVKGGAVLAVGFNSPLRSGFSQHYATHNAANTHSELAAIRSCRRKTDLAGAVIYNIRRGADGCVRGSFPCSGCQRLLLDYGIKKCYYTTDFGTLESVKTSVFAENGFVC